MTESAEANKDQNPLTKPKFIISAVVVAILVALAIILPLLPKGEGAASPAPTMAATSTATATVESGSAASICGLPTGPQSKLATAPTDTKWELVGKVAAPTSPREFGPGKVAANGLRSCFSHSPTGALYAAVNLTALSGSGKAGLVYKYLSVPGPQRDKMLNESPAASDGSVTAQLAGFMVRSYDSDQTVVDLAFKADNGTYVSIPVPLQWSGGDWKFIIPATGDTGSQQISDLSGYIEWGAF
ncbi:hypothetical protein [Arthrobacter sp. STN4]|uniref:hypothetical protein n=1 Tax=Arthrobacter sp. STN4 TaxID=2923276 RepID=UPI002119BE7E|nr:hypothetical protein [Arthrobacter sp. STN4]MCQ9165498.1 hypothetical protein [Arthrobacter sp. STN4]